MRKLLIIPAILATTSMSSAAYAGDVSNNANQIVTNVVANLPPVVVQTSTAIVVQTPVSVAIAFGGGAAASAHAFANNLAINHSVIQGFH